MQCHRNKCAITVYDPKIKKEKELLIGSDSNHCHLVRLKLKSSLTYSFSVAADGYSLYTVPCFMRTASFKCIMHSVIFIVQYPNFILSLFLMVLSLHLLFSSCVYGGRACLSIYIKSRTQKNERNHVIFVFPILTFV